MRRHVLLGSAVLSGLVCSWSNASTINLVPVFSNESTGAAFLGSVTYAYAGGSFGTLTWVFKNTTPNPPVTAAFLTGFTWDTPNAGLTYTVQSSTHGSFGLISTGVDANPLGSYTHGLALGSNWLGGGSPNNGIAIGDTGTFVLKVSGTLSVLSGLTTEDFLADRSFGSPPVPAPVAVRFKGIEPGGLSDKIVGAGISTTGGPTPIPLPSAALAGGLGVLGLAARRTR